MPGKNLLRRKRPLQVRGACAAAASAATMAAAFLSGAMAHPGHEHAGAVHAPSELMVGPVPLKVAVAGLLVAALAVYALKKQRDR